MDGIGKTERATGRRGVCKIILTAVAAIVMLCAAAVAYAIYAGGGSLFGARAAIPDGATDAGITLSLKDGEDAYTTESLSELLSGNRFTVTVSYTDGSGSNTETVENNYEEAGFVISYADGSDVNTPLTSGGTNEIVAEYTVGDATYTDTLLVAAKVKTAENIPADGTITAVRVNTSKVNEYGAAGIYTSMTAQDLLDYGYVTVTIDDVEYTLGCDAEEKGFTVAVGGGSIQPSAGNTLSVTFGGAAVTGTFAASSVSEAGIYVDYDMDADDNFIVNGRTSYIYDNQNISVISDHISVYTKYNDGSLSEEIASGGYTLSGNTTDYVLNAGDNEIRVSYGGFSYTFVLKVVAREVEELEAVYIDDDSDALASYVTNISQIKSHIAVTATYNDGTTEENFTDYDIVGDLWAGTAANSSGTISLRVSHETESGTTVTSEPFDFTIKPARPSSLTVEDDSGIIYSGTYTSGSAFDLSILSDSDVYKAVSYTDGSTKRSHASYTDGRFGVIYCEDNDGSEVETKDTVFDAAHRYIIITYTENGVTVKSAPITLGNPIAKRNITPPNNISGSFTYSEEDDGNATVHSFTVGNYDYETMAIVISYNDGAYTYVLKGSESGAVDIDPTPGSDVPVTASNTDSAMTIGLSAAGEYKIYARLRDTANCQWSGGSTDDIELGSVTGSPGSYEFSSSLSDNSFDYGESIDEETVVEIDFSGVPKTISDAYKAQELELTYTYYRWDGSSYEEIGKPVAAGSYYVTVTIEAYGSYGSVTGNYLEFTINKITKIISSFTAPDLTYGDDPQEPTLTTAFEDTSSAEGPLGSHGLTSTVTLEYTGTSYDGAFQPFTVTYTYTDGSWTNSSTLESVYYPYLAGEYSVTVTVAGSANYGVSDATDAFVIRRQSVANDPAYDIEDTYTYSADGHSITVSNYDPDKMSFVYSSGGTEYTGSDNNGAYYTISGSTVTFYFENVISDGYKIVFSVKDNYAWASGSDDINDITLEWTVVPQALIVSPDAGSYTYTGGTLTYTPRFDFDESLITIEGNKQINAGTYDVTITLLDNSNYTLNGGTGSVVYEFKIAKKQLSVSWNDDTLTYDSNVKTPTYTVSGWVGSDESAYTLTLVCVEDEAGAVNAGPYTARLTLSTGGNMNYYITDDDETSYDATYVDQSFTVEKATIVRPDISAPSDSVYNGSDQTFDLYGINTKLSVAVDGDATVSNRIITARNSGSYTITVSIADEYSQNFEWAGSDQSPLTLTWTIDKAPLTVTWSDTDKLVYNGEEQAPGYKVEGWWGDDSSDYTLTLTGQETNAGYDYTATLTLTTAASGTMNYYLTDGDESGITAVSTGYSISPEGVTVSWKEADGWSVEGDVATGVYNGSAQAPSVTVEGIVDGDDYAVSVADSSKGTDVDTYSGLQWNITGADSGNYIITNDASLSFAITPARLTVTWSDTDSLVYNGQTQAPGYEVSGWKGDDSSDYTLTLTGQATDAGDDYTATLTLTTSGTMNYYFVNGNAGDDGTVSISTRYSIIPYTISLSDLIDNDNRLYEAKSNGDPITLTFTVDNFFGTPIGEIFSVSGNGTRSSANSDLTEPYTITLTLLDANNYVWGGGYNTTGTYVGSDTISGNVATVVYWITALQYEFSISFEGGNNWTYGDTAHTIVLNIEEGVSVDQKTADYVYYKTEDGVQTGDPMYAMPTDAGTYLVRVTLPTDGTYYTAVDTATFEITKRVVSVTIDVESEYVYGSGDDNNFTGASIGTINNNYNNELSAADFILEYREESAVAGSSDIPKVSGSYIVTAFFAGQQNNYELSYELSASTASFTIIPKEITITINDSSVVYGGELPRYTLEGNVTVPQDSFEYEEDGITSIGLPTAFVSDYTQGADKGTYHIYLNGYKNDNDTAVIELANYTVTVVRGTLTVGARGITVSFDVPTGAVYDGNKHVISAVEFKTLYNNVAPGVVITYSGGYDNDTSPVNAGEYTYTISIANENYVLTGITDGALSDNGIVTGTFEIDKADVSAVWTKGTGSADYHYEYSGTDQTDGCTVDFAGFESTDSTGRHKLSYTVSGTDTSFTNVGTYTFTAYLEGIDANNYELVDGTETQIYYIDRAEVTLTIDQKTVTYGDVVPDLTFDASGLMNGETLSGIGFEYALTTNYEQGSNAGGEYWIYFFDFDGSSDTITFNFGNYTFTATRAALTVNKQQVTVSYTVPTGDEAIYSNSAKEISGVTFTTADGGSVYGYIDHTVTYDGNTSDGLPVNAGEYAFEISVTDINHIITAVGEDNTGTVNGGVVSDGFVITSKEIAVTWHFESSYTYDGTDQSKSGGEPVVFATAVDEATGLNDTLVYSITENGESSVEFRNAGTYEFTASFASENGNYILTDISKQVTILPYKITDIVWSDTTVDFVYNGSEHSVTIKFFGFADDGSPAEIELNYTVSGESTIFRDAGDYTINAIRETSGNYDYSDVEDKLSQGYTIKQSTYDITSDPTGYDDIYDAGAHNVVTNSPTAVSATASGELGVWAFSTTDNSATGEGYVEYLTVTDVADSGTIYYKLYDPDGNHETQYGSFTVTVKARSLTLYATAITQYGTVLPTGDDSFIYTGEATEGKVLVSAKEAEEGDSNSGFAPDEGFDDLTKSNITYTSTYDAREDDGIGSMYTITLAGGFTSSNYDISYDPGVVTVTPRKVTVTLVQSTGHTYGNSAVDLSDDGIINQITSSEITNNVFDVSPSDIIDSYSVDGITLDTSGDTNDVGDYQIILGNTDENYDITLVTDGYMYVITARSIGISLGDLSFVYGEEGYDAGLSVTVTNDLAVSGDTVRIIVEYRIDSSSPEADYTQTYLRTADGEYELQAGSTAPENAATYNVRISVGSDGSTSNYVTSETSAAFTIAARNITLTVKDQTAEYSGEEPEVDSDYGTAWDYYSAGGYRFIDSDEQYVTLVKESGANAGEYRISVVFGDGDGAFVESNYNITYNDGSNPGIFEITKKALTLTADSDSVQYGNEAAVYTFTSDGFTGNDNIGNVVFYNDETLLDSITDLSAVSGYAPGDTVGSYDITFSADGEAVTVIYAQNYTVTLKSGSLTVNKRDLVITISNVEIIYGNITDRTAEVDLSDISTAPDSDTLWSATGGTEVYAGDGFGITLYISDPTLSYGAADYDISFALNDFAQANYNVTLQEGSRPILSIEQKAITVTADDVDVEYGTDPDDIAYTYSYDGEVYGETIRISGDVEYSSSYTASSSAGSGFEITVGIEDLTEPTGNYKFVIGTNGDVNVTKRNISSLIEFVDPGFIDGSPDIYGMYNYVPSSDDDRENKTVSVDVDALSEALAALGITAEISNDGVGDITFRYVYTTDETHTAYNGTEYDGTADGLTLDTDYKLDAYGNVIPLYAGTYKVTVEITSDNFTFSTDVTTDFRILKMRVTAPAWSENSFTADAGTVTNTLDYSTLYHARGDTSVSIDGALYVDASATGPTGIQTNVDTSAKTITMSGNTAGTYSVILTLTDSNNYVWDNQTGQETDMENVLVSWSINQYNDVVITITGGSAGDISVTVSTGSDGKLHFEGYDWRYGGAAITINVTATYNDGTETIESAQIQFRYYDVDSGNELLGSVPTDAGNYYVIAYVSSTAVYPAAQSAPVYFTISKALVEKPDAPSYEDFVYSGSELIYEIAKSEYYTVTGNTGTGAGTYYATVKLVDENNYEWAVDGEATGSSAALSYEWKIAKKVLTAPSDPASGTYNHGSAVSSSLTGVGYDYDTMRITGVSATGSNVGSISVSGGAYLITAVNADTYTITVKLRDSGNYEWADAEGDTITLTWIVNKYVVAAPSAGDPTSISYDGSQHSYLDYYPAFADSEDSAYYYLDGNLYATDAGSYKFTAVLRDSANYEWKSGSVTEFVWSITKAADNEITGLSDSYGWTFGDDPEELVAEAKYGSVTFEYYDAENVKIDEFTDRTAAGTYTVKAVVTGTDNYDGCEFEITVVIARRTVSVTWSADGSLVYDGSDLSGSVTAGYYDIDGGFRTLDFDINDDFIDAGSYLFTVSQLTEGNYVLDEETLSRTFEIAPLSVTVKVTVSADSMPYGGEVPEAGWTYGDGGKFADRDNINVTISQPVTRLSGTGTYTVTASASGTLGNYDITYENATIEVTARRITVTALPAGSTYGDNLVNLTSAYYEVESGEADGLEIVNGDVNVVTLYVEGANGSRTDAGTYDIKYLLNNANYEVVGFVSAVYTVSAREVSVVWSTPTSDAMTYNGVNKFIHVSAYYVDIDGEEIPLEVTPTDMTDAGTYSLTASFAEADPNYTLTGATETYTVLAKRIYVTIINNSHVYGDVETATASSDGIIENDADSTGLLLVYTGTAYNGTVYDGTIGDGWTLGVEYTVNEYGNVVPLYAGEYTITVYAVSMDDMASDGNYIIASGATGSFYVAKAVVSSPAAGDDGVSLSAVYDGTTLTATIPESELYRVSENEGGVSVGIYRVVLTLTDSDNYMWEGVTTSDITLGFSVTKAANSVSDVEITSEFEYGASPDPSASSVFGTVVYRYYVKSGDTYTEIAEPPAAGTYYVRAEVAGTSDFDGCVSDYAEFTITKKSVAKPVITSGAVYNGETQTVTVSGFDPSVMTVTGAGAVYTIENGVLTITATESGTYSFGIALRDSDNYEWADGTTDTVTLDWTIEQGEQNLVWLIAVLGTVVFAELLAAIIRGVSGRKKNGNGSDGGNGGDDSGNDGDVGGNGNGPEESGEGGGGTAVAAEDRGNEAFAFLPMICASTFVPAGQMAAIIALASAAVVMGVIDVVVFVRKRKKKRQDEEAAPEETPQEEPSEAAYAEEPAPDISAEEPAAPEIAAAVIGAESPADEEPARTEPAAEAPSEELPPEEIPAVVTAETAVQPPEEEDAEQDDDDNDFENDSDVEIIECVEVLPDEPAENETADVAAVAVPVRRKIVVRYKFSFRAKLIQAPRELQARFGEFADEARAYKKVKFTVSWKQVRIYSGRNTLALVLFKGRKICVAFALDPAEYAESKYGGIDVSSVKRFAKTPYLLKLTSARKTRYAKELFAAVAAKYGLEKGSVTKTDFYLPFRTTEELIKVNLVKLLSSGDITGDAEVVKADIADLIRDKITLAEAGISLSDEVAAEYMETADDMAAVRKPVSRGRRAIINIDTLAQNFAAEDVVTLDALKEKKLVPSGAGSLKVLARGLLDKPLTVEADDFSIDAVKMILLTGGRPVKI